MVNNLKVLGPKSQWQCLLQNLGRWQGSFTRLTPQGEVREDTPTLVALEGLNNNQTMRQTIQYFSGQPSEQTVIQQKVLEYSSLNRSVLFFENGAFSQGSIQLAPFSEFGAELGLIQANRRLRLVQLFDRNGDLVQITLIREQLMGTDAPERPPLSVEALLGHWQGEAVTLAADGQSAHVSPTTLYLERRGEELLQHLTTDTLDLSSTARINGSILQFNHSQPVQVLLLPDGASCTTPLAVKVRQPLLLEVGWLLEKDLRQRLIRSYNAKGEWLSLTLVTERKTSTHISKTVGSCS